MRVAIGGCIVVIAMSARCSDYESAEKDMGLVLLMVSVLVAGRFDVDFAAESLLPVDGLPDCKPSRAAGCAKMD